VGRVDVHGEVGDPVHPRRLGEAVVVDIVNVRLVDPMLAHILMFPCSH
jgi:hypothetical protein